MTRKFGAILSSEDNYAIRNSGTATLITGTSTISDTGTTASSIIVPIGLGVINLLGTIGVTLNAGTGFTLTSTNLADTATILWLRIEP